MSALPQVHIIMSCGYRLFHGYIFCVLSQHAVFIMPSKPYAIKGADYVKNEICLKANLYGDLHISLMNHISVCVCAYPCLC